MPNTNNSRGCEMESPGSFGVDHFSKPLLCFLKNDVLVVFVAEDVRGPRGLYRCRIVRLLCSPSLLDLLVENGVVSLLLVRDLLVFDLSVQLWL